MSFQPDYSPYVRCVHYYETDQMAVVHHSNYIRYFEEARVDYLKRNGIDFQGMEKTLGILFPVLDVQCSYEKSARLGDALYIHVHLERYTGVRFTLGYRILFADGSTCARGSTTLGLLNRHYMPISLKHKLPEVHQQFRTLLEAEQANR